MVETPGSDIEYQIDALTTALSDAFAAGTGLEAAADHVLGALLPDAEGHNDDVTLLLAQFPAAPLATATMELPARAPAVAEGRSFVLKTLTAWDCTHRAHDARLLVSEVLTNAVQHAEGPLVLHLRAVPAPTSPSRSATGASHLPQPRLAAEDEESGRGLILVDTLADNWGVRPTDQGKTTLVHSPVVSHRTQKLYSENMVSIGRNS
ncbi:ATP-binding protein [Streptomyces sp. L7]